MKPVHRLRRRALYLGGSLLVLAGLALGWRQAWAAAENQTPDEPHSPPLHPSFALLDQDGVNVLNSGGAVSTMQTCGQCHDTEFIETHSFHADVGLGQLSEPGSVTGGRPWEISPGWFGSWNPLTYRTLSPEGDERVDLTTPDWLMTLGARHAGGGPGVTDRDGVPLAGQRPDAGDVETATVDPQTGIAAAWDWRDSGTVEMNCFLCHTAAPANAARLEALHQGDFGWASTATLSGTGIVRQVGGRWRWDPQAFDEAGNVDPQLLGIQDPTSTNCGQCHGLVHVAGNTPLTLETCSPDLWTTLTTGQILSAQRISDSGLNLVEKDTLTRSWDVHAERILSCTECHYSLNNPIYIQEPAGDRPEHLIFDPRRIDFGEYLYRPLHQFAKGQSAQSQLAPELDNTLRTCESCHDVNSGHEWLPYVERHAAALACETCHIPQLYAPARQYVDWTVLETDGTPVTGCRGVVSQEADLPLFTGYQPVLLPRDNADGTTALSPYNLISAWYWVYGEPARPVPARDLQAAWLEQGEYPADILAAFDTDGDGDLAGSELVIDNQTQETLIAARLEALGLDNPRIQAETQPYGIHHDIASGEWAVRECAACHSDGSRVTQDFSLADRTPGGVIPVYYSDPATSLNGEILSDGAGGLVYRPATVEGQSRFYLLGHDAVRWIDTLGAVALLGVLAGASVHGGIRYASARRRAPQTVELRRIYMYTVYERLWHWLQTATILLLVFTGLVIHRPETFGIFSFSYVVQVHNVLAAVLVVNAALAAFYHLASGQIRQFLPRPYGFFDQAILQAKFYLRGIFRGEGHPFEKTPERKMNPLQQVTYLAILNVLLPLQVLSGLMMWGSQRWPGLAARLGGMAFLSPFHTLIAWLFAAFIVLHVYLTTTGHTPLASIRGMVNGWDEIEITPPTEASESEGTE